MKTAVAIFTGEGSFVWKGDVELRAVPLTEAASYTFHGLAKAAAEATRAAVPEVGRTKRFRQERLLGSTWVWSGPDEKAALAIVTRTDDDGLRSYLAVVDPTSWNPKGIK